MFACPCCDQSLHRLLLPSGEAPAGCRLPSPPRRTYTRTHVAGTVSATIRFPCRGGGPAVVNSGVAALPDRAGTGSGSGISRPNVQSCRSWRPCLPVSALAAACGGALRRGSRRRRDQQLRLSRQICTPRARSQPQHQSRPCSMHVVRRCGSHLGGVRICQATTAAAGRKPCHPARTIGRPLRKVFPFHPKQGRPTPKKVDLLLCGKPIIAGRICVTRAGWQAQLHILHISPHAGRLHLQSSH